jgi:ACR3 family arsenite efflux pump ArsB
MDKLSEKISSRTKALPLFVLGGIIVGLSLGKTSPAFGSGLANLIPLGLFLMIFPNMVKVELEKVFLYPA